MISGEGFLHRTAGHLLPSTWETLEKSPAGQLAPRAPSAQGFLRTRKRQCPGQKAPDILSKQNWSLP